jgi:hypothetical protein
MLPFGVTIPATVPQGSEMPEGLMNNPVFALSSLHEILFDDQIKKNEMGGICDKYGGEARCRQCFGGAT